MGHTEGNPTLLNVIHNAVPQMNFLKRGMHFYVALYGLTFENKFVSGQVPESENVCISMHASFCGIQNN